MSAYIHAQCLPKGNCGELWLGSAQLAQLAGIAHRNAKVALLKGRTGRTWRGVLLDVREVPLRLRGGRSGIRYQVRLGSLPEDLQSRFREQGEASGTGSEVPLIPAPKPLLEVSEDGFVDPALLLPPKTRSLSERDRLRIRLASEVYVVTEPNTTERAAKVAEVAEREGVPARTLREWVRKYEQNGCNPLVHRRRADSGKRRRIISRAIDAALRQAGRTDEQIEEAAATLRPLVKRCYGDHLETSAAEVVEDLRWEVMQLCRSAGVQLPDAQLRKLCRLPRSFVEPLARYRNVAIYERDKGRWSAQMRPRIKRDWSDLEPAGCVVGDVWHMDIYVRRGDGSLATPKAVFFLDMATRRVFIRTFLMAKGEMIRREHVLQTFVAMLADKGWGVPRTLYFDNGSAFGIENPIAELEKLGLQEEVRILNALPHNPQSKPVEGYIGILKRYLARFPGYIGGDRFRKKTSNLGREPDGFCGSYELFATLFQEFAVEAYHCTEQDGHLKGETPYQRFNAFLAGDKPWQARRLLEDFARLRLGKVRRRAIQAGGSFTLDGTGYRCDPITHLSGAADVFVAVPVCGSRDWLPVFDFDERGAERFAGVAQAIVATAWNDRTPISARVRAEREQVLQLGAQSKEFGPVLRLANRIKAHGSIPEPKAASVVAFAPEWQKATDAVKRARTGAPAPAAPSAEEAKRQDRGRRQLEQMKRLLAAGK